MKNLADFKRKLIPGQKVKVTNFQRYPVVRPWQTQTVDGFTQWTSTVDTVRSNAVGFKVDGKTEGGLSWLDFPKASEFEVMDGKAVIFWDCGKEGKKKILEYEFLN